MNAADFDESKTIYHFNNARSLCVVIVVIGKRIESIAFHEWYKLAQIKNVFRDWWMDAIFRIGKTFVPFVIDANDFDIWPELSFTNHDSIIIIINILFESINI